jgi:hypothetical protein
VVLGEIAERLVERVVEHVERVEVVAVARALLRAQDVLQRGDVVLGREVGRAAHAGALERLADELRVGDGRRRDARDEGAELRHDLDQPVVSQSLQRLADRRAAHAEQGGELVLGDLAAGRELDGHDGVAQQCVDRAAGPRAAVARGSGEERLHCGLHTCIQAYGINLSHPSGGSHPRPPNPVRGPGPLSAPRE